MSKIELGLAHCPACSKYTLRFLFDYCHCSTCDRSYRIVATKIRIDEDPDINFKESLLRKKVELEKKSLKQ